MRTHKQRVQRVKGLLGGFFSEIKGLYLTVWASWLGTINPAGDKLRITGMMVTRQQEAFKSAHLLPSTASLFTSAQCLHPVDKGDCLIEDGETAPPGGRKEATQREGGGAVVLGVPRSRA